MRGRLLVCMLAAGAFAAENPVAWTVEAPAKAAAAGATIHVKLGAEIQPGWHVYALEEPRGGPNQTEIWVGEDQPFEAAGAVKGSKAEVIFDPNFSMQVGLYTRRAEFDVPVRIEGGAGAGRHMLAIDARYQSCNDRLCLPPRTITAQAQVLVK